MKKITSKVYYLRIIFFVIILLLTSYFYLTSNKSFLVGFFIFSFILLSIIYFYFHFVDIYVDERKKIHIFHLNKEIKFQQVLKIGVLPIYSKGGTSGYGVFFIRYLNDNSKKRIRFCYIKYESAYLIDEIFPKK